VHVDLLVYDPVQVGGVNVEVFNLKSLAAATVVMVLMLVMCVTGANILLKLSPLRCANPLATSLALKQSTAPVAVYLTLNTHLTPMAFLLGGWS
jgi:hypothetical protein